jgi:hypothetical protein
MDWLVSRLRLLTPLKRLGPHKPIATRHPPPRLSFAKNDRIKGSAIASLDADRGTTSLDKVI